MSNIYPILALLLLTVVCGCEQASNARKSPPPDPELLLHVSSPP